MKLDVKEISAEVHKKANEFVAKICMRNETFSIKQIKELREAYIAGAIGVLVSIKDKVDKIKTDENEKTDSNY